MKRLFSNILISLVLCFFLSATNSFAGNVTLAWDPPDFSKDVTGYKIHYGTAPGTYSRVIDVGKSTSSTIGSLIDGQTYYFIVTAYNASGYESNVSNEVSKLLSSPVSSYTLLANISGNGTVTGTNISCGTTCSYLYVLGTKVSLLATPATGYIFAGWSGACTGTGVCLVTMDASKTVTATFTVANQFVLTITKAGKGRGRVKSKKTTFLSDPGIDCGDTCVKEYEDETTVTLTAEPESGSSFAGWSGACSGTGDCTVTVSKVTSVTANFIPAASVASSSGDPNVDSSADGGGGGGGCFIATAAFGSYLEPHVKVLRDFRDRSLLTNSLGQAFVNFYYRHSPPIADVIRKHASLKYATRVALFPLIYTVEYPYLMAALFLIAAGIGLAYKRRRNCYK